FPVVSFGNSKVFPKIAGTRFQQYGGYESLFLLRITLRNTEEFIKFDRIAHNSIYKSEFSEKNSDRFLEDGGILPDSM
ncbi:MAG: hypothetical protein ACLFVB_07970, partial [Thermoplasmata archaeon]